MTTLFDAIIMFLSVEYHPGNSTFSVEPCADGKLSSFYQTTVCKESKATAVARYERKVKAAFRVAEELLCTNVDNKKVEGCTPYINKKNAPRWRFGEFVILALSISGLESGFREDVDNGRGWARDCSKWTTVNCGPDDVGGRGRGPGRESCGMQIHPDSVGRFSDYTLEDLLGTTDEAYERCFRVGMRMILRSRGYCDWYMRTQARKDIMRFDGDWVEQTISMYGTGTTCLDYGGKTLVRAQAFNKMYTTVKQELRKKR